MTTGRFWSRPPDFFQNLNAIHPRHLIVQQNQIWVGSIELLQGLRHPSMARSVDMAQVRQFLVQEIKIQAAHHQRLRFGCGMWKAGF